MPSLAIHPPHHAASSAFLQSGNPLPELLKTPSGLAIIEIQGTLNMPSAHLSNSESSLEGAQTDIGRLVFPDYRSDCPSDDVRWTKRVYLYVGQYQRMTGEVKRLPKPLAVVRRRRRGPTETDMMVDDEAKEELEIADFVRWKIIFSQRPEPVGL